MRAQKIRATLSWFFQNWDVKGAGNTAKGVEVAIVGVHSDSGEQYITVEGNVGDRNNLSSWHNGDEVVKAVAANNNNTIVVVHSVGPMTMDWVDHPNITAIVWAGLPGQESGNALVDVLFGDYNPSGRLPYTIAAKDEDYPVTIEYVNTDMPPETDVNYTEGLFIDYRHFLAKGIKPLFGFGFGLSYTTFDIKNLQVSEISGKNKRENVASDGAHNGVDTAAADDDASPVTESEPDMADNNPEDDVEYAGEDGPEPDNGDTNNSAHQSDKGQDKHGKGGHDGKSEHGGKPKIGRLMTRDLHSKRWKVRVDVTNTGDVNGCEVPQLYLQFPEGAGEPPRVLRDFERINLNPGDTQGVEFELSKYDVSIWDVVSQNYVVPEGEYKLTVARNAFDEDGAWGSFCFGC